MSLSVWLTRTCLFAALATSGQGLDITLLHIPLEVIRSRVFVLSFGAKGADVARRLMHQAMADHFVLSFEAFTSFGPRTCLYRTVVWSNLTVHVCVGTRKTGEI